MVMCHNPRVDPRPAALDAAHSSVWPGESGALRWALGEWGRMSEVAKSPRRFARRRRANIDGDTQYVRVSMSEFERAQLKVLEERTGRSPSEILVSAALYAENSESLAERRAMAVEFIAARRYLAALSNNVNQLARHANATDEFPEAARTVLTRVRAVADRINTMLDSMVR